MWFQDISVNESNKKLTISYFKLGRYNSNYQRTLEKQFIITQGKVTIFLRLNLHIEYNTIQIRIEL